MPIDIDANGECCHKAGFDCRHYSKTDIHNLGICDWYNQWIEDKKRCQQCLDAEIKDD